MKVDFKKILIRFEAIVCVLFCFGCSHSEKDTLREEFVYVEIASDEWEIFEIDSKTIEKFSSDLQTLDRTDEEHYTQKTPGIIRVMSIFDMKWSFNQNDYEVRVSPILSLSDGNSARQIVYNDVSYLVDTNWNNSFIEAMERLSLGVTEK
ncbi:MAG: hypothetical protein KTR15_03920 [Phycisphaeraceae bacterium]|nr:hypothetical protein [Phycisphaeraceae bacterium]